MGCDGNTPALSEADAAAHASDLDGWTLDYPKLRRVDTLPNFRKALAWINRVGMLAEEHDHHPDFHLTGWNRVELVLWTHAINGISLADVEMARRIRALA
ncbi:MAG: 4a-hydroxytetrahydrobiopterin dehydratase [Planctomycetota bacterium]|nr:4a-hydroxytetrahydrobiopterin dehydratase [Planctomycetota bacterium]